MVSSLSKEQMDFLRRHKIPLSQVFDATGLKKREYREVMLDQDKLIAIGVTPCKKSGHSMRSRSGNCVQCNLADLGFATRNRRNAYVYVSASRSAELVKVGLSQNPDDREVLLNSRGYGGIRDWSKMCQVRCDNAGQVEFAVHDALKDFGVPRSYLRGGQPNDCLEIFSCGYRRAREALLEAIGKEEAKNFWQRADAELHYNFRDQRGEGLLRGRRAK